MPKNPSFQPSRRELLKQGANASFGFILISQFLSGQGKAIKGKSLLALAAAPDPDFVSQTTSEGPITVTVHFTAKANKATALIRQLTQALPAARQATGCRYAHLYAVADRPSTIVLLKGWDSRKAQAEYLQQEQRSGKLAELLALVEGEPMVEYWEFQSA